MPKELILVGDKVLISPDEGEGKTDAGLYLPQNVREKERVQAGRIVKIGPGYPVPDPSSLDNEPWAKTSKDKYFPLQANVGDYCIFLRDQGIEITFEKKRYIVASQSAILVLIRDNSKSSLAEV
ncbi:MAG: co-chaperone GroES family protein [Candidatus Omnitrophota bacterium]|nr:co-chaperone GroES family protein [Candidatus Omnitrophota bacterium]